MIILPTTGRITLLHVRAAARRQTRIGSVALGASFANENETEYPTAGKPAGVERVVSLRPRPDAKDRNGGRSAGRNARLLGRSELVAGE